MSTEEAINEYVDLAKFIFKERKLGLHDGLFKATRLETAIQGIVEKHGEHGDPGEEMLDMRTDSTCKA
jgi:hypothetical protein